MQEENMEDIISLNKSLWDKLAHNGVQHSIPFLEMTVSEAEKFVYRFGFIPDVKNLNVLCLAAGDGQDSVAFGLLGAHVTVLELSEAQLFRDKEADELTLANLLTPLPIVWLSFTATKQNKTALLRWATAREQNTRNFTVLHSVNGINWAGISTQPAAGNSNSISNYSYVHTNPVTGINYYRILQADLDNHSSYSDIRTLTFTNTDKPFIIIGNPVTNNMLTVQVNEATSLALFTADGKLLWQEQVNAEIKNIDVSRYAKGTYFLKANSMTQKVVIQ